MRICRPTAAAILFFIFSPIWASTCIAGEEISWPAGLEDIARVHFSTLQKIELAIRDSDAKSPLGIVPTNTFDRASHECHDASGQAYRLYDPPALKEKAGEDSYLVVAGFRLFYREANSMEELFSAPWKEGSGGAVEARFERAEGFWKAASVRETAIPAKGGQPK